MEHEGGGPAGQEVAQNVRDGQEGVRPELTLPRPANLRACIYPKEAENPPAAAVAQIARAWLHEHGLEESARACVCAEKAGPQGSGWSVESVLALLHVLHLHDDSLSRAQACEAVLELDTSNTLRAQYQGVDTRPQDVVHSFKDAYKRFLCGGKAPVWCMSGMKAWQSGGVGGGDTSVSKQKIVCRGCLCRS